MASCSRARWSLVTRIGRTRRTPWCSACSTTGSKLEGPMKKVAMAAALVLAIPSLAAAQDAAAVKKGQGVYTAQKCGQCHAVAGKGGKTGGTLDGVGTKLSAADLKEWVVNPTAMTAKAKSTKK